MSKIPLYWHTPYKREIITKIKKIIENKIEFEKTIFYPGGGGQPCDTGLMVYNDNLYTINNVICENGSIWHFFNTKALTELHQGQEVLLKLDWERRYALMKAHTAQHLVSYSLHSLHNSTTLKATFEPGKIEIEIDKELTIEEILQALDKTNRKIIEGGTVKSEIVSKNTFTKEYSPKVRGNCEVNNHNIRIIIIDDFDIVCCGGTHINDLNEIKGIFLDEFKHHKLKLYVGLVESETINDKLASLQKLEEITTKRENKLIEFVKNKMLENEKLEISESDLLGYIFTHIDAHTKMLAGVPFNHIHLPYIGRKTIQKNLREISIPLFLSILGEDSTLYLISNIEEVHANKIAQKFIETTNSKGGGNKNFAQIALQNLETLDVEKLVKELIETH